MLEKVKNVSLGYAILRAIEFYVYARLTFNLKFMTGLPIAGARSTGTIGQSMDDHLTKT